MKSHGLVGKPSNNPAGRPATTGLRAGKTIGVRVTVLQYEVLRRAAGARGISIARYVLWAALAAAGHPLDTTG